ncbi:MAG: hypothetical protein OXD33_02480 [Rhodobacteraceae bacterium]|nr:hypothetical protein [Paracoccaceae bacterium]
MTARHPYYCQGHETKISTDADQTELNAVITGSVPVVAGIQDDDIADSLEDHYAPRTTTNEAPWQTRELATENAATQIMDELMRRQKSLGDLYPFEIQGDSLTYKKSDSLLYEFLLCTCLSPNLTTGDFVKFPRLFERIAARLTANSLGHNTGFSHIGAPSGRGNLKASVQEAIEKSQELHWGPRFNLPDAGPHQGDQGVDFIIWRDFECGRKIGQQFYFGQCACGNNWETKLNDVSDYFMQWFEPLDVSPTSVFAIPFVISDLKLSATSRQAGIVMDRLRLVRAAKKGSNFNTKEWRDCMSKTLDLVREA